MRQLPVLDSAPGAPALADSFGRIARTLRVSVTDRCNFRCLYCMPTEDMDWFPRGSLLTFEEIHRVVGLLVGAGMQRVRLTGGEPTLRRGLTDLVKMLRPLPGLVELNMTTNGVLLQKLAAPLRAAGLDAVTISLDTLKADRFAEMTRRDALADVLAGIDSAREAAFGEVKVNCVTLRGVNDDEWLDFARFSRDTGLAVRFIEYMPLDGGAGWGPERVVPGREVKAAIEAEFPLVKKAGRPEAPARAYRFADGADGEVGFINPVTEPFCASCDRLRMTADGKVKNCMFDRAELDVLGPLRSGASDEEVLAVFETSVRGKGPGGLLETQPAVAYAGLRNMSRLGG